MTSILEKALVGLALGSAACLPSAASAQDVLLNSGYDHSTNSAYTDGDQDEYWVKIASYEPPLSSPPDDIAYVVPDHSTYEPSQPDARWLAHNTDPFAYGVTPLRRGYQIYRKCFCLNNPVGEHRLDFRLKADDEVQVWLNQITNVIVPAQNGNYRQSDPWITVDQSGEGVLEPGRNCIYVQVENSGGKTGFLLQGRVTGALSTPATGPEMRFGACCDEVNNTRGSGPASAADTVGAADQMIDDGMAADDTVAVLTNAAPAQ